MLNDWISLYLASKDARFVHDNIIACIFVLHSLVIPWTQITSLRKIHFDLFYKGHGFVQELSNTETFWSYAEVCNYISFTAEMLSFQW